jgi:hypothetical protein
MTELEEHQARFIEIFNTVKKEIHNVKDALRKASVIMLDEQKDTIDLTEDGVGVNEPMEVTFCFDDEHMESYLAAKRCMEDKELGRAMCHDETIGRLAEHYLDVKKGEGVVYDSDEDE